MSKAQINRIIDRLDDLAERAVPVGAAPDVRTALVALRDEPEPEPGEPRNLARFTTDDAEAIIGRPLTDQEYRHLVKTLENSEMGIIFAECLDAVLED